MTISQHQGLDRAAIRETFGPLIARSVAIDDQGLHQVRASLQRDRRSVWRRLWARPRTTERSRQEYEGVYQRDYPDVRTPHAAIMVSWQQGLFYIGRRHLSRVRLTVLEQIMAQMRPHVVLDLGCGDGLLALVLSARWPAIKFIGGDITRGGPARARAAQSQSLSPTLRAFHPHPDALTPHGHQRAAFLRLDATALPFANQQFDAIMSTCALEQINQRAACVLDELTRVCRSHLLLCEPWAEVNSDVGTQRYLRRMDYWRQSITTITQRGFRIRALLTDFPQRVTYNVGVLWAERASIVILVLVAVMVQLYASVQF